VKKSWKHDGAKGLGWYGFIQVTTSIKEEMEDETKGRGKRFPIERSSVERAYKQVRSNGGAAGIDGETLLSFEAKLDSELYKLQNRMSAGSYFPKAVKGVEIPKGDGKKRLLGIPTVSDRVAQQLVVNELTPRFEAIFHASSYGYRPNRSAHDALEACRQNCYLKAWVIDLDIKGFFDNIPHDKLMEAVERHVEEKWMRLYILRWLKAPMIHADGREEKREKGTPQGGVISPLLANLYLHYALDVWLQTTEFKHVPFERYADDVILHCDSLEEAQQLLERLKKRFKECGLELHPEKTKIVYCKNGRRPGDYDQVKFTFLGYDFKPRTSRNRKGELFLSFGPQISLKAIAKIIAELRELGWHRWSQWEVTQIASLLNPKLRGWINYYGQYHTEAMAGLFHTLNVRLVKWIRNKYKSCRGNRANAWRKLKDLQVRLPNLFFHWEKGFTG
jgi:group II intron reverse transcriptase/maturase